MIAGLRPYPGMRDSDKQDTRNAHPPVLPSGTNIVRVCRCLSRSLWLRKQKLERSLTVLAPALEVLLGPLWGADFFFVPHEN